MIIVGAFAVLVALLFYGGLFVLMVLLLLKLERIRGREEMTKVGVAALYFARFLVLAMALLPMMELMAVTISRGDPWPPEGWDSARLQAHVVSECIGAVAASAGLAALVCGAIYLFGRLRASRVAHA